MGSPQPKPLQGRATLVTGGGRGIGRATALQLARLGAAVAVLARSASEVDSAAEEMRASGGQAAALTADVASHAAMQTAVQSIRPKLGPVDVLINNAG